MTSRRRRRRSSRPVCPRSSPSAWNAAPEPYARPYRQAQQPRRYRPRPPRRAADKKKRPDAHVTWLVNRRFRQLVELCEDVDDIVEFRRHEWGRLTGAPALLRFLRNLHRLQVDCVIDCQGLFRSAFFAALVRAPRKLGFADAREGAPFFYSDPVAMPSGTRHAVERNLLLAAHAVDASPDYEAPRFAIPEHAVAAAADRMARNDLDAGAPLLAVAPAARWPSKSWPARFFAAVIAAVLQQAGMPPRVWLLGTRDERDIGDAICAACPGGAVVNLMGDTDLPTVIALLRRTRSLLTNDSGPMHIAAALGVPTVALFGPTDPTLTGPYGDGHTVFRSKAECAPCFKRKCPLAEQVCLSDEAKLERVVAAVRERL